MEKTIKEKTLKTPKWLFNKELQNLLEALSQDNNEARIVGGAVRNFLLEDQHKNNYHNKTEVEIDIATTNLPDETISFAKQAGFKAIATGYDFGTVTVVGQKQIYEVTTLRQDIVSDGRHAKVVFGRDWQMDAKRRDFTINALYMDKKGKIYDEVDGFKDIESQTIRFIGDATLRIQEDYLRILRFFRFFAYYGQGRPDSDGLLASARLRDGLLHLSSERVWSELKKILKAQNPARAVLWMRQTGVLTTILSESEKWGIDALPSVIEVESDLALLPDPILRLMSIVPKDMVRLSLMAERLRFSNLEKKRLLAWVNCDNIHADCADKKLQKLMYKFGKEAIIDSLILKLATTRGQSFDNEQALKEAGHFSRLLDMAQNFKIPILPIKGADLIKLGYEKGPELGKMLKKLEKKWLESGFELDRSALLALL